MGRSPRAPKDKHRPQTTATQGRRRTPQGGQKPHSAKKANTNLHQQQEQRQRGQAEVPERHTPANRKGRKEGRKKRKKEKNERKKKKERKRKKKKENQELHRMAAKDTKRPNPQGGQTPKRKTQHQTLAQAAEWLGPMPTAATKRKRNAAKQAEAP